MRFSPASLVVVLALSSAAAAKDDVRPRIVADAALRVDPSAPNSPGKLPVHFEFNAVGIKECWYDVQRLDSTGTFRKLENDIKSKIEGSTASSKATGEQKSFPFGSFRVRARYKSEATSFVRASEWKSFVIDRTGELTAN